jgi:hypothetical protein
MGAEGIIRVGETGPANNRHVPNHIPLLPSAPGISLNTSGLFPAAMITPGNAAEYDLISSNVKTDKPDELFHVFRNDDLRYPEKKYNGWQRPCRVHEEDKIIRKNPTWKTGISSSSSKGT